MTAIPQPNNLASSFTAVWDAWNRLVSLSANDQPIAAFEYDGTNRRILIKEYGPESSSESSGSSSSESSSSGNILLRTRHLYYTLQSQVIEERIDSSEDAAQQYIWNVGYIDDLLLRDRDTNGNGTLDERLYALTDLRYSVMALANTSGSIAERFAYEPHGRSMALDSTFTPRTLGPNGDGSVYAWEYRYTGRELDLPTGLYYFRARYYHPELGRFISRDPIGYVDGMSLYRGYYVSRGVDPNGTTISNFIACTASEKAAITAADAAVTARLIFLRAEIENLSFQVTAHRIVEHYLRTYGLKFQADGMVILGKAMLPQEEREAATRRLQFFLDQLRGKLLLIEGRIRKGYIADCCACYQNPGDADHPFAYVPNSRSMLGWGPTILANEVNFCPPYFGLAPTSAQGGSFRNPADNQASILFHELTHLARDTTDDKYNYVPSAASPENVRGRFLKKLLTDAYFYQNLQDNSISRMLDPGIRQFIQYDSDTDETWQTKLLGQGILFYLLVPNLNPNLEKVLIDN